MVACSNTEMRWSIVRYPRLTSSNSLSSGSPRATRARVSGWRRVRFPHRARRSKARFVGSRITRAAGPYEGLCEEAVELAYGTIGRYPTAYDDWLAQHPAHLDYQDAPRGALVFYKPEVDGADGHVAISLGNGYVTSTGIDHRIGVARIDSFPSPLGWAEEPW